MEHKALSPQRARQIYDLLGRRYDWASLYEGRAKARSFELLDPRPGEWLLNVGVGTGREHRAFQAAVAPRGLAFALDLSGVMAALTHQRTDAPVCQADTLHLPYASECFDALYCAYVLDLLPGAAIPDVIEGFRRVLKPGGRMLLLSMTEGVTPASKALVGLWKAVFDLSPTLCAGCRPLKLVDIVERVDLQVLKRQVLVQWAVPSEIILARRPEA